MTSGPASYEVAATFSEGANEFRELLQQSSMEPHSGDVPESPEPAETNSAPASVAARACASDRLSAWSVSARTQSTKGRRVSQADVTSSEGVASRPASAQRSSSQSAPGSEARSRTSPSGKDGVQGQSSVDQPDRNAEVAAALLPVESQAARRNGSAVTPVVGADCQTRRDHASTGQASVALPKGVLQTVAAAPEDLRVELSSGRGAETPDNLAFALRLKPLAAAAPLATPSLSETPAPELGIKSSATSNGVSAAGVATRIRRESGPDSRQGSADSGGADEQASRKTNNPERPEKSARTDDVELHVTPDGASAQPHGEKPQAAPQVQIATSAALPDAPSPSKGAAMPAASAAPTLPDAADTLVKAPPTRDISLQVSDSGDRKVVVRLAERAGEILVSVRTPDEPLAREMRQELGSLTGKLAQSGYETEQFAPHSAGDSSLPNHRNASESQDSPHGDRNDANRGGSGQRQQHDERDKRPAWMDEMEDTSPRRQNNRSTAWSLNH